MAYAPAGFNEGRPAVITVNYRNKRGYRARYQRLPVLCFVD